ncbi:phosphatase PAP2 family protein [Xanthomonas axonopodis]
MRWPLVRLLVSMLASTVIISLIKRYSGLDCPWDIAQLGGTKPYYTLFDPRPFDAHSSGCFPAGHAGSGYAWLALYFFLLDVRPRWRLLGLLAGIALGAVFWYGTTDPWRTLPVARSCQCVDLLECALVDLHPCRRAFPLRRIWLWKCSVTCWQCM